MTLDELKLKAAGILGDIALGNIDKEEGEKRFAEIRKAQAELEDKEKADAEKRAKEEADKVAEEAEARKAQAEAINNGTAKAEPVEKRGKEMENLEYRQAFKDFVLHGKEIPQEMRAGTPSTTGGLASVIPAETMNTIIQKMEDFGNIIPLVKKVAYPAGLIIPTSNLVNNANWTTAEGADIAYGAKTTGSISFAANKLCAALGISFEARIESLSAFENALATDVAKSMTKKLEEAIVNGTGAGMPTGITSYYSTASGSASNNVSYSGTYKSLLNILKAMPSAYASGAVLTVNINTFYDMLSMVDTAGQPIARVNQGITGEPTFTILGRRVIVTDFLQSVDTASAGDCIGYFTNYDFYTLNTAYAMDLMVYEEPASRNRVYQSVGLYDGKMTDTNGLVFIAKA